MTSAQQMRLIETPEPVPGVITPLFGKAPNTKSAYWADFKFFQDWCAANGLCAMPAAPATLARYLQSLVGIKALSTIERKCYAIAAVHADQGYPGLGRHPLVQQKLTGIAREHQRPPLAKHPAALDEVQRVITAIDKRTLRSDGARRRQLRDRAMILMLFALALRRDELRKLTYGRINAHDHTVTLTVNATGFPDRGRLLTLRRGRHVATDPVRALGNWLAASGIVEGAIFRAVDDAGELSEGPISRTQFARTIADCFTDAGLDATLYSAHSFRVGVVEAVSAGGGSLVEALGRLGIIDDECVKGVYDAAKAPKDYLGL